MLTKTVGKGLAGRGAVRSTRLDRESNASTLRGISSMSARIEAAIESTYCPVKRSFRPPWLVVEIEGRGRCNAEAIRSVGGFGGGNATEAILPLRSGSYASRVQLADSVPSSTLP